MGCGIARFGRRGLKTTETWKFWSQILSPGVLRRGAPGVLRHSAMGFGGAAPWGLEGRCTDKTLQRFIILRCASRSLVIKWDLEGQRKMINHGSVLSLRCPSKPHGAARMHDKIPQDKSTRRTSSYAGSFLIQHRFSSWHFNVYWSYKVHFHFIQSLLTQKKQFWQNWQLSQKVHGVRARTPI